MPNLETLAAGEQLILSNGGLHFMAPHVGYLEGMDRAVATGLKNTKMVCLFRSQRDVYTKMQVFICFIACAYIYLKDVCMNIYLIFIYIYMYVIVKSPELAGGLAGHVRQCGASLSVGAWAELERGGGGSLLLVYLF